MKRFLFCLLCVFALGACSHDDDKPVLRCGGYEVQMDFLPDGNSINANINGDELELVIVPSASGAKYSGVLNDIVVVLWQKGETWTMMLDEEEIIDCRAK